TFHQRASARNGRFITFHDLRLRKQGRSARRSLEGAGEEIAMSLLSGPVIAGVVLAVLIGLSLGLLGGGGSILTVPILVYVIGLPAHEAIALSLLVVGTTSLAALAPHARRG